jgi:hypothetical protein
MFDRGALRYHPGMLHDAVPEPSATTAPPGMTRAG